MPVCGVTVALTVSSVLPGRARRQCRSRSGDETVRTFVLRPPLGHRNGFVILQVALSIVLLTMASLFTRSLLHLAAVGPGFDATHTLIAAMHPLPGRYDGSAPGNCDGKLWNTSSPFPASRLSLPPERCRSWEKSPATWFDGKATQHRLCAVSMLSAPARTTSAHCKSRSFAAAISPSPTAAARRFPLLSIAR